MTVPCRSRNRPICRPATGAYSSGIPGVNLSAPERVRYSYRLEGLDRDWVSAVSRRVTNYNSLRHGHYRFVVRAGIPGRTVERNLVRLRAAAAFLRDGLVPLSVRPACGGAASGDCSGCALRQIRQRFALVLEERARLAREIHDTLAQGFVGISSQLDAVALTLHGPSGRRAPASGPGAQNGAPQSHGSAPLGDGPARFGARRPGSSGRACRKPRASGRPDRAVHVYVDVSTCARTADLPEEMEQHLLRIAQEAVTNTVKHAARQRGPDSPGDGKWPAPPVGDR